MLRSSGYGTQKSVGFQVYNDRTYIPKIGDYLMTLQATLAQRQAIHTRNNAIVVAGAGSGKTRVLVERYLKLLEDHSDWALNALVAITFTKKAAGEMRDRVRAELERRYIHALKLGDRGLVARWSTLLGQMDSARITTIHSLCADLLRANAAEARLDPDFTVLDETAADILLNTALQDAFDAIATEVDADDHPSPALALFERYDVSAIRDALLGVAAVYADLPPLPDDVLASWGEIWQTEMIAALARLTENLAFREAASWRPPSDPSPDDKLTPIWRNALSQVEVLLGDGDLNTRLEALYALAHHVIKLNVGGAKGWGDKATIDEAKAALRTIRDIAQVYAEFCQPLTEIDEQAAALIPAWHALITRIQREYQAAKQALAAVDFDDLEKHAVDLLTTHPEVAARYRGREFKHLLIDEFQDTNTAQWQIAQQLASLTEPGSLFVVGDPKQSIYAYRGADVSVFDAVRLQITHQNGDSIDLATSFRTHAPLVDRFNRLFEQILAPDDTSPVRVFQTALGTPMDAHRSHPPNDLPPLELILLDKKALGDKPQSHDLHRWQAREIATRLHQLVHERRLIYDKAQRVVRPINYGDLAILFQTRTALPLYESVFRAMGLPFLTVAGVGYYGRQEVHDVLNLLRALYNPTDDLSLAAALRSPLFGLSDDTLYALRRDIKVSLWEALTLPNDLIPAHEQDKVMFAANGLHHLGTLAGRVTISELLQTALAETHYLATLTGLTDGAQMRGNVEKLVDIAQASGKITLGDFTELLSDLSTREVREGDAALDVEGVVKLMTVHASKGLEFPVVVLADADRKPRAEGKELLTLRDGLCCKIRDEKNEWARPFMFNRAIYLQRLREDAERRRLLYVAATRAQDLLIISGQAKITEWTAEGWLGWLLQALPADDDGGTIRIHIPTIPDENQPESTTSLRVTERALWQRSAVRDGQPLDDTEPLIPVLIQAIPPRRLMQTRHLAATSIADLGGALHSDDPRESEFARERFRRRVLYDAPTVIPRIVHEPETRPVYVRARSIGDIVHNALRWWEYPFGTLDDDKRELLKSYAWEVGVTDDDALQNAVERAEKLLTRFSQSQLYRWICQAYAAGNSVFRELPFIYERDNHIVHGVIDILFQRPTDDGSEQWVLADYKTSQLPYPLAAQTYSEGQPAIYTALTQHAKRYHLQVGLYAEAAAQHLGGNMPDVYIHYISYAMSIPIHRPVWQQALAAGLGSAVAEVIQ